MMQLSTEKRGTIEGVEFSEESGNPFAAVIAEYQRRLEKSIRRGKTKAALRYAGTILLFEKL